VRTATTKKRSYPLLRFPVLLILGLVAILGSPAPGQGTAAIVGTVTDPTAAVIPNANITITNTDTGLVRTTVSNSTGNFNAPELPIGHYQLHVEAQGFKSYERKDITLNVGETVRVDIPLVIGNVGQSITVEENALQVQADTNDISQTITSNQIENLATNGRNVLQLTTLVPGAASNMPDFDSPGAQFQNRSIQFNGMRSDDNNWLIDGGEAYDRGGGGILLVSPSQDALQQFTITTSNYAADLGNSSGGMISMAVKNGTKQFHGGAWEYNRNDALDAYSYFLKQTPGAQKAELRYNAFGFNLGGPIEFKSSNPKTFFFYNQEWRREINGGSLHQLVPTRAMFGFGSSGTTVTNNPDMTGEGTAYVPNTTDPAAIAKFNAAGLTPGQPFPNDQIPLSLVDPTAAAYLAGGYMLPPNDASGQYYNSAANTDTYYREEIARVDHQFNQKFSIFAHAIYDSLSQSAPIVAWTGNTYPTVGSLENVPSWAGVVRATYQIGPNLLNEAAFNENGNNILITNTGAWHTPKGFNTTPLFNSNTINKVPGIDFSGGAIGVNMDNGNWPWTNTWRSNQAKDDLSWIKGAHNFKLGFAWLHTHKNQKIFTDTAGTYHFYGGATGCSGPPNCAKATNGVGLADFLLGDANDFGQAQTQDFVSIAFNTIDGYVMDDWRVSRRLTLNLGLRWEALPHAFDTNDRLSNFYPSLWDPAQAAQFTSSTSGALNTSGPGFRTVPGTKLSNVPFYLNGVGLAGKDGIPQGLVDNHWSNMAPRIGFAYDLFGNQRTVLRSGGGIFYERNAGNEEYNMGANVPFSNSASTNSPYMDTPTVSWVNGASAGKSPTTPQSFTGVQKTLPITTVYQFSFGIEQQFRSNVVATLGYVGNTSDHMSQTVDTNTLPLSDTPDRTNVCGSACGGKAGTDADYFRQYVGFQSINLVENEGNAHYHSLQATMRATAWHNLTLGAAYTYSHAWDVIDAQLFNNIDDPFSPRYQYGTSGFDRRHIGVVNFDYDMPVFQHSKGAAHNLMGGWTISGITLMQTGNPLSVNAGNNTLGLSGSTTDHADLVGKVTYPHTATQWFNPVGAFAQPAPLTFGNSPKNIVKGPGRDNWNLSLFKDFHFTERSGVQFKAESFNTWNHTQFTGVNTGVLNGQPGTGAGAYNSTAGAINATADPRVFQLGAKAYF
jgi:hypothetical protein